MEDPAKKSKPPKSLKPGKKKDPRKITGAYLENAGLYYLEKFSTSSENFRQVMTRKVMRSAEFHETDPEEGLSLLSDMIERFLRSGLLDDKLYTDARTKTLHKRGNSARQITAKLMQKGVPSEFIDQSLQELKRETGDPELKAAATYARRRRLGPYRLPEQREDKKIKDLSAMARAGFPYHIAHKVIEADTTDELEDLREMFE